MRLSASLLIALPCLLARMETYLEYVSRSLTQNKHGSSLELELRGSHEGLLTEEVVRPLALENARFLDGLATNET